MDFYVRFVRESYLHNGLCTLAMDDKRDVTAKLVDVAPPSADWPDGYELNITDTILRLRYREGWDHEVFMEPGIPYQISIGANTH